MIFYHLDLKALAEASAHQKNESNQWLMISKSAAKKALKQPNLRLIDGIKIVKAEQEAKFTKQHHKDNYEKL